MRSNDFLDAWNEWDAQPSSREKVVNFQLQCIIAANQLDMEVLEFTDMIMELRRDGKTKFEVIELVQKMLSI